MKSNKSLTFENRFVVGNKKAEKLFKWKAHNSEIKDKDGQIVFSKKNVLAPEHWSATAIDIAASKYFRRTVAKEKSIAALVDRVASGVKNAVTQSELFSDKKTIENFVEEIKYILLSQKAAFNSPVWFNLGLKESYKLSSYSHHYH